MSVLSDIPDASVPQMQSKHVVSVRLSHVFSFKNSLNVLFFCTKWRMNVRRGLTVTWFLALVSTNIQRGREIIEMRLTVKKLAYFFLISVYFWNHLVDRIFRYHVSMTCTFPARQPVLFCFRQNLFWVRNLLFVLHVLWEFGPPCASNGRAETLSGTCQRAKHISARTN